MLSLRRRRKESAAPRLLVELVPARQWGMSSSPDSE